MPSGALLGLAVQLDEGELRGAVDGDEEVELALGAAKLGEGSPATSGRREMPWRCR